ncbi:MAG: hypothetical protein ACRCR1_05180 [Aeromonas sp.]
MPHTDTIPIPYLLNDLQVHVRAAFMAHLKPGAHLLNGQCAAGEDLLWLRAEGYVVTACEDRLADAKIASQQSGQAVRVCPLVRMHSVLPYDGIWLSRPLDSDTLTLTSQLLQVTNLLTSGAPLYFPLQPFCNMANEQQLIQLQQLITSAGIPLQVVSAEFASGSTPEYAYHFAILLRSSPDSRQAY